MAEFNCGNDLFLYTRRILINKNMTVPPKLATMCCNAYNWNMTKDFLSKVKAIDKDLPNKDKQKELNKINAWLHS